MKIFLLWLTASMAWSQYPQKIVTRYKAGERELTGCAGRELKTRDGAVWKAAERGLTRADGKGIQYFHGLRYLADDAVECIAPDDSAAGVWVKTRTGVSRIELKPMTLAAKAEHFERRVSARHDRYGMVASSHLKVAGDLSSNQMDPSDNDGLWTAMYAAAECFRYAVTKSPEALTRAKKATEAVLFLEQVTGVAGYPARSYIKKGDWRGQGGVWHWSEDGAYEWKADTSSDEIVGHFYIFGIAYDLLPDPALKKRIAGTARRIMDHILEHGYNLMDIHGNPTYWGRWSHEYFETRRGRGDAPLNAVELLSFLRTTHHITGDARYEREYRKAALDLRYMEMSQRYLERHEEINYSDEELAMLPFYLLFRYEKDKAMLAEYRKALDQWWRNIERERNPLWTYIYRTANPGKGDLAAAQETLYRIPMDLISWRMENSWRKDIEWAEKADRFRRREAKTWLPPDERPAMKWNGNPFIVDGGGPGNSEDDGSFFLLPYWMGRYHGFLRVREN